MNECNIRSQAEDCTYGIHNEVLALMNTLQAIDYSDCDISHGVMSTADSHRETTGHHSPSLSSHS